MQTTAAMIEMAQTWMTEKGCTYHSQTDSEDGEALVIGWFCGSDARAAHSLAVADARKNGTFRDRFADGGDLALVICAASA